MMKMVLMNITLMTFYPHYHTRKRQRGVMSDWVSMISKIIEECPVTAHWLVTFLSRCFTVKIFRNMTYSYFQRWPTLHQAVPA